MSYKALAFEKSGDNWFSVKLLRNNREDDVFWMDIGVVHGDIEADWNQYIFSAKPYAYSDKRRSDIQKKDYEFEAASSEAVNYLIDKKQIAENKEGYYIVK